MPNPGISRGHEHNGLLSGAALSRQDIGDEEDFEANREVGESDSHGPAPGPLGLVLYVFRLHDPCFASTNALCVGGTIDAPTRNHARQTWRRLFRLQEIQQFAYLRLGKRHSHQLL